ncbi:MGMT family protein, partial [Cantharellus anzutake]|uniref:MGMT family protein n=1 Tax=Cantharellus anzutake TaxID=1750568 RepID=UPI001906979F
MDSAEFHAQVYRIVRLIPFGRVTSYGHIALLVGLPRHARHVGNALKWLGPGTDVPWHRVIASSGQISSRGPGTNGAAHQRDALVEEDVEVDEVVGGTFRVSLARYGWFPS